MRLIDAEILKSQLYESILVNEDMDCLDFLRVASLIDAQPTAYDINKIVEELEKVQFSAEIEEPILAETNVTELFDAQVILLDEAIEIIKQGCVSDDVCEWKQISTAKYKTSCGYKLEEYFDTNACYCKQCGKKIKVVE